MEDPGCISRGCKTNDNRSYVRQKAETETNYVRRVPGAEIYFEVLVQIQKFDF